MSCSACNIHRNGFPSESDYLIFRNKLALLVKNGKIVKIIKGLRRAPFSSLDIFALAVTLVGYCQFLTKHFGEDGKRLY